MTIDIETIQNLRDEGLSWREIGLVLGREYDEDPRLMQERVRSLWRRAHAEKEPNITRKSHRVNRDESNVSEVAIIGETFNPTDEDGMLKKHGYDPQYWKVIDSSCTRRGEVWTSRVKVVKRDIPQLDATELAKKLSTALKKMAKEPVTPVREYMGDKLAVVAMYDVHYGRRGIKGDHKRTEEEIKTVIGRIKDKLNDAHVEKILLAIGQDFLNSDTIQGTTTGGTPQDNSLAWHEMIAGGLALASWVIDELAEVADVEIVYNEGNHDRVFSYAIVKALEERYRDIDWISVDSDAHPRKYKQFGSTLIGLSHGKDEANLPTVMQMEMPQNWGKSTYRYWFLGHLHKLELVEKDGVIMVRCPAMAFEDDWTRRKGFVGTNRAVLCGIIDKETGLDELWLTRP